RPHGAQRRHGPGPPGAGRRHGGRAGDGKGGEHVMSEPTEANGTAGAAPETEAAEAGSARRHVRVVLVDDHRMFRTGVQAEIGQTEQTGVEVVGEAADVDQAVSVITATRPEVVLL